MKDGSNMSKRLSRWVVRALVLLILFSSVSLGAAENADIAPEVDLSQYKSLTVGYVGTEVAALKQRMYELGYYKNNTVNESFTANTADYVKKFETVNGLPVDGVADPEMQALFFSKMAKRADGSRKETKEVATEKREVRNMEESDQATDLRFLSFLEGQGNYSEEALGSRLFYFFNAYAKADLGFCGLNDKNSIRVQGILLGHFYMDDMDYLAIGVKNRNKQRTISIIEWPLNQEIIAYSSVLVLDMIGGGSSSSFGGFYLANRAEVISFIEDKMGDVIVFSLSNHSDEKKFRKEFGDKLSESKINFYIKYVIPKWKNNRRFVSGLLMPTSKVRLFPDERKFVNSLRRTELIGVSNCSEAIAFIGNNSDQTPALRMILYNKYVH